MKTIAEEFNDPDKAAGALLAPALKASTSQATGAWGIALGCILCIAFQSTTAQSAPRQIRDLPAETLNQLRSYAKEKSSRSPAQQKMASQLVISARTLRREAIINELPRSPSVERLTTTGLVEIDIKATVNPALLEAIQDSGGAVINSYPQYNAVRARVPLIEIQSLAARADVQFIQEALQPILRKDNTSEGDAAHAAPQARADFGVTGAGIKVGVLSDSVDFLADSQASGDLPAVTVLEDTPGSGEGTAMLEIVHDLAPGAELYFATAFLGQASFAANIIALADAGSDVIVDDVGYLVSPFQDDIISQAVDTVAARGVLYFSSAGNGGNLNDGTSGVWEGDYNAGATAVAGYQSEHLFPGGDPFNTIVQAGAAYELWWAEPIGSASNDYDLFLLDQSGAIVATSTDVQNGSQSPSEVIGGLASDDGFELLVLSSSSTEDHFLTLRRWGGGQLEYGTSGSVRGHPAAAGAFSVAAVRAAGQITPFTGSEVVEVFSSDGPRRIFFDSNGNAITPGDFSSSGGTLRSKPDIAAADGVATSVPGFDPFFGTSAAAPHAAAIAALMLEVNPGLTPATVQSAFEATALDIEQPGRDRDSGVGIIMADTALAAVAVGEAAGAELRYAITPCRILDTRDPDAVGNGLGTLAGGGEVRLALTINAAPGDIEAQGGNPDGCGIPIGATTVDINITAVNPLGFGFLRMYPYVQDGPLVEPNATVLAWYAGKSIANALRLTQCVNGNNVCDIEFAMTSYGTGTELVIEVLGYYLPGGAAASAAKNQPDPVTGDNSQESRHFRVN